MNIENRFNIIDIMFRDNLNFIVKHHIESYNKFFNSDLRNIIVANNPIKFITELDEETKKYKYSADIYIGGRDGSKIYYGKPIIYDGKSSVEDSGETKSDSYIHYMMPNEARLRNMTYSFSIHYDVDIEFKILKENNSGKSGIEKFNLIERRDTIEKVFLGNFPIMLKSDMCLLSKLHPSVSYNLGECKNDPGGYFIISGKEKAIVSQENRADNILYVKDKFNDIYSHAAEIRSASEDASKPVRTLSVRIMADQPSQSYKNIVVSVPNIRKPVPLFILMRALGVISDKDIIRTCLLDLKKHEELLELFIPSVYDAGTIFTQNAALQYLSTLTKGKTVSHVLDILMNYFLPHIGELNFKHKALYLGYIVKRLLLVYIKAEEPTNRDKYNFKRVENTGMLLNSLFIEFYKKQISNIFLKIDQEYHYKGTNASSYQEEEFPKLILDNRDLIFNEKIVEEGFKRAFKGNWGGEAHTKRPGVVQQLNRLSFFSFMCQLRKTNLNIGDATKMIGPRLLNGTQYGMLCPLHSPDGGNIGLHKHLSTSVNITSGVSSKPFIAYLRKLGMISIEECSVNMLANATKAFLNGAWIGCITNPAETVQLMKLHRRNNLIYTQTSILFDIKRNEIQVWVDGGRLCRPLFYIENGAPSYTKRGVIEKIEDKSITWDELTKGTQNQNNNNVIIADNISTNIEELQASAAVLEYIDASEGESMKLFPTKKSIEEITNQTHAEIHDSLILGLMANQIIFPENNPYPRNAFSCGQSKQGVSLYSTNFQNRIDKSAFVLNTGQTPLTHSRYYNHFTKKEHNYGENAIVAIMCYSGFNVEDAVIINGGSLERGLFRTTYYNMYEDYESSSKIGDSNIDSEFMNIENNPVLGLREGYDYSKLDEKTGLIREETIVNEKTIVIGKAETNTSRDEYFVDASVKTKKGQTGIVDKSFMTEGEAGQRIAKVRIRAERIPQIGDKFCSRAGQKGTIGLILPEEDMPTTENGIKPDIIVNPHAMPSRMTIGHLVETLSSKMAAILGGFADCTAFINDGPRHKVFGDVLRDNGYHSSGNQILYNGMTGEQLETEIYFGPTFYLRLKHMPKDKVNYRARGPRTVLTRQTVGGRANDGGLRIGEMDRDCLIAHGMTKFISESMMERGDEYFMAVCNKSGTIAVYNENKNLFLSPILDGPLEYTGDLLKDKRVVQKSVHGRDFSIVRVPYAFKLLMQELKTMGVQMRLITEDSVDKLTTLFYGHTQITFNEEEKSILENDINKLTRNITTEGKTKENKMEYIVDGFDYGEHMDTFGYGDLEAYRDTSETKDIYRLVNNKYKHNGEAYDLLPAEKVREFNLDENLSTTLEIGSIVTTRTLDNLVSAKRYRLEGISEKYNQYHLRDLNPMAIEKMILRSKNEIYYKGVKDIEVNKKVIYDDYVDDDYLFDDVSELGDPEDLRPSTPSPGYVPPEFQDMDSPEVEGYASQSPPKLFDMLEEEVIDIDDDDEDNDEDDEEEAPKEKLEQKVLNDPNPTKLTMLQVEPEPEKDSEDIDDSDRKTIN